MTHLLQTLPLLIFPALVIAGALRDLVTYTIPNWISVALAAAFPIAALAVGLPLRRSAFTSRSVSRRWSPAWRCSPCAGSAAADAKLFAGRGALAGWPR